MKKLILIIILFITFLSSPSWSGTLTMDDLVEKEDLLFYKKFSIFSPLDFLYPFTGEISGLQSGSFKNGKREGIWETYYESGQLWYTSNYKDGGLNGLQVEYYQNGQLKMKGNLKFGRQDGLWEYFNEDGSLLRTETLKEGKKIETNP